MERGANLKDMGKETIAISAKNIDALIRSIKKQIKEDKPYYLIVPKKKFKKIMKFAKHHPLFGKE